MYRRRNYYPKTKYPKSKFPKGVHTKEKKKEFEDPEQQNYFDNIYLEITIKLTQTRIDQIDEIFIENEELNNFIHCFVLLDTTTHFLKLAFESPYDNNNSLQKNIFIIQHIENIYLSIFDILTYVDDSEKGLKHFILKKTQKLPEFGSYLINIIQRSAETFAEYLQNFLDFPLLYERNFWNKPEFIDFSKICRVRSGIQFLSYFFDDIKIDINNKERVENFDFKLYSALFIQDEELVEFDDKLKHWQEEVDWYIDEDIPFNNIDLKTHWWFKKE